MRAAPLALLFFAVSPVVAGAQRVELVVARAESLAGAGRPWHAAETLIAAHAREAQPHAWLVVEGARAELRARRYDRARSLLEGQPWLEEYAEGEALALLADAEANLSLEDRAAEHYAAARRRSRGVRAALLAVREGVVREALGETEAAANAYGDARRLAPLASIDPWLRLRQAGLLSDTSLALLLLERLPAPLTRAVPTVRARIRLAAGDSAGALAQFRVAGRLLDVARLALVLGDTGAARTAVYELLASAPETDDAAAAVGIALGAVAPQNPAEAAALAGAMRRRGSPSDALVWAQRAVRGGDSSSATLLLMAELEAASGRRREAAATYARVAADSTVAAVATYRRARTLLRAGDRAAVRALTEFAERFPDDTAAPTALFLIGDWLDDRNDAAGAGRWYATLMERYPADQRTSVARFRLAARHTQRGAYDSAAALYRAEVEAGGPQQASAQFWLGKLARQQRDTALARAIWTALARADSVGYYGLRARREAGLAPPAVPDAARVPALAVVAVGLARIDTLLLAGLDSAARAEVRDVVARPPDDLDVLLAWSEGLMVRGWGPAAIRLAWQAYARAPNDPRALRAIYPWPNRAAVEAEAAEFGVDPVLLASLVRQESVFDPEALSPAGARGLAQLMVSTAAQLARGLDVAFQPGWLVVPDLNLHLGAAHLAALLRQFDGRVEVALAAYNAGGRPARRWLARPGADDPDQYVEGITYAETRGYVRAVLRNRELYRAMHATTQ